MPLLDPVRVVCSPRVCRLHASQPTRRSSASTAQSANAASNRLATSFAQRVGTAGATPLRDSWPSCVHLPELICRCRILVRILVRILGEFWAKKKAGGFARACRDKTSGLFFTRPRDFSLCHCFGIPLGVRFCVRPAVISWPASQHNSAGCSVVCVIRSARVRAR